MDFEPENIVEDSYWAFGLFAKKDGSIDYNQLKKDLEQIQYYIAAISLETSDGTYFARLVQTSGYKWIFENSQDNEDDPKDLFKDFVSGSVFEKFSEHAIEVIKAGFEALQLELQTNEEAFKKNGINLGKVKNLVGISDSIIRKSDKALANPVLK